MRRFLICSALLVSIGAPVAACSSSSDTQTSTTTSGSGGGHEASSSSIMIATSTTGSGGTGGMMFDDGGGPSSTYPAYMPDVPQVIDPEFGPILKAPIVYPVFFPNDDPNVESQVQTFVNGVGATPYWAAIGTEYGVGPLTGMPLIQAPDMMSGQIDDSTIQAYLAGKLNADDPLFPAPDANTMYAFYFPEGVSITLQGAGSCVPGGFGGYHNSIELDTAHASQKVPYAVIPRCEGFGMSTIDAITTTSSHEFIEASTDPFPETQPAWVTTDNNHFYWAFVIGGGEVGDMCAIQNSSFTTFPGFPFMVQRTWSDVAARAYHDPCVPTVGSMPYFNTAVVLPDPVTVFNYMADAVIIPVGETKPVELDLFSDGAMPGPWDVRVIDAAEIMGEETQLTFAMDKSSGVNGDKISLQVTHVRGGMFGASAFIVSSTYGPGMHLFDGNLWVGFVADAASN